MRRGVRVHGIVRPGATHDRCCATLVFHVTDGEVDGTDMGDLTVAAILDSPKVMTEGGWRLGMFCDHSIKIGEAIDIAHPAGSELTTAKAARSNIDAFGIRYEGASAFSSSRFAWSA